MPRLQPEDISYPDRRFSETPLKHIGIGLRSPRKENVHEKSETGVRF